MPYHPALGISLPEMKWAPGPSYLLRRDRILQLYRQQKLKAEKILEVGSGPGALLHDFSRQGITCTALETSLEAQKLARVMHAGDPRIQFYSQAQDSWASQYDGVMAFEVLEHIEDDRAALRLWKSWLKPQGFLLLSVPARQSRWSASDVWAGHFRRYEWKELIQLLNEEGFQVEYSECWGFPLVNALVPFRSRHHARILAQEKFREQNKSVEEMSARSGTERPLQTLFFKFLSSWLGRGLLGVFNFIQGLFARRDWGDGYIVLARSK